MTSENQTPTPASARVELRKSRRFPVLVPAEVRWHGPSGGSLKASGRAEEVNAQGGLLHLDIHPVVGEVVELTNLLSAESAEARVLAIRRSREDAVERIAIELLVPSETFWGVNFQLKKYTADLLRFEQTFQSSHSDLRLLREFRDAVDCVRRAAWAIEECEQRHLQERCSDTMLSLLTAERIRRATYLCNELSAELEACDISFGTKGIAEFYRAIDRVNRRLEGSFTYHESQ
jgi:hypothetical protein